ncbi:UNVERIFIED_CONTAM: P-loop guanosine triphosphatase YjiA [Sesamum radiatum]|uniref:P-loop guanosine triphosphatase YjiA n=1 Tax=Sesamum radiatum TaxID=300843 RepID=A0AAW2TWL3_SESRA
MAIPTALRFLLSRTTSRPLFHSQHPSRFAHSLLGTFRPFIGQESYSPGNFHFRSFSTEASEVITQDLNSSVAAALNLDNRVPATVITGFLGSGKFGEVDIDSSLVASHSSSNEDIIMVNNGCLCCTVRGDLVKMLLELVKKKRDNFDHIVIETTGLAKPGPVIETFCSDELLSRHVKLDGVVTLVDSMNAMKHLNEVKPRFVVNEAVEQIAYADRIILNKIDLVTEAEVEALKKRIKLINGMAQIKLAKYGIVDMDFVLGVGGYDLDRIESEVKSDDSHCSHHHEAGHEHHKGHHHDHVHDSAVSTVSIVSEGTLDLDYFDDWLERLVEEKGDDLYRMKGILSVSDSEQRYVFQVTFFPHSPLILRVSNLFRLNVNHEYSMSSPNNFQAVHSIFDGCPGKEWGPDEKRINKLVFIGRNLDETALRKGFKGCLV